MGKDDSDIGGSLRIGPTTLGMVRISVEGEGFDIPLDFDPDEADEIAEELRAAAEAARGIAAAATKGKPGAKVRPKP
jgi:phage tail sheath gpL-like